MVVHRYYDPVVMDALVAKVKIYASLRLDERRLPQDGRFVLPLGGASSRGACPWWEPPRERRWW